MSNWSRDGWLAPFNPYTRYIYDKRTRTIIPNDDGGILHYQLEEDPSKEHTVRDLYIDYDRGLLYYKDPSSHNNSPSFIQYEDPEGTIKNLIKKGGYYKGLLDLDLYDLLGLVETKYDQFTNQVRNAADRNALAKLAKLQAENPQAQEASKGVGDIQISVGGTSNEGTTEQDAKKVAEYESAKKTADLNLQNMLYEEEFNNFGTDTPKKDETIYYSYGNNEIDLNYYLHNLKTNLLGYLRSKNWSEPQKNAFIKAYRNYTEGLSEQLRDKSSRFSTDASGYLLDDTGVLDGSKEHIFVDKLGNIYNSLEDIADKKLRKSAIEFSPNDEVANYFNTVGKAIVGAGKIKKEETPENKDFDINNNGFLKFWSDRVNPAGGKVDFTPYWQLDPVGTDNKRGRTNRTTYLAHQLQQYVKKINSSDYNFENSPFKTKENFIIKVKEAINNLNNGWDDSDLVSLSAIGITPEFYTNFMSEEANPLASSADKAAEAEAAAAKKEEDAALLKKQEASKFIANTKTTYTNQYNSNNFAKIGDGSTNGLSVVPDPQSNPTTNAQNALSHIGYSLTNMNITGIGNAHTKWAGATEIIQLLWNKIKEALKSGNQEVTFQGKAISITKLLELLLPLLLVLGGEFEKISNAQGESYYVSKELGKYGEVLCFKDNKVYWDWAYRHRNAEAYKKLANMFEEKYNEATRTTDPSIKYSFKLGGTVLKFEEGGTPKIPDANSTPEEIAAYMASLQAQSAESLSTEQPSTPTTLFEVHEGETPIEALVRVNRESLKSAATAKGLDPYRYLAKQRTPEGVPTFDLPGNGVFTTSDYARMGGILADITSLVLDPLSGAVVGVGGTASNFLADWLDNSVTTTEMWKNLAANIGFDALGIIPIVGDAAGTGGKLIKSIKTLAPKIMYGLAAYGMLGTLKNSPNILASLQKVTSDEKLTVGDYLNIAQAISALAGLNNGLKAGAAKKYAKRRAKVDDAVGLGLVKDGSSTKLDFIFRGEPAKKIRKLAADGKTTELNDYIKSLEGFSDYKINTELSSVPIGSLFPIGRTTEADGTKSWEVRKPYTVKRNLDLFDIFDESKLHSNIYDERNALNLDRQNKATDMSESALIPHEKAIEKGIELFTQNELYQKALRRTEGAKKAQDIFNKDLNGVTESDGTITKEGLLSKYRKAQEKVLLLNDTLDLTGGARESAEKAMHEAEKALAEFQSKKYENFSLANENDRKFVESYIWDQLLETEAKLRKNPSPSQARKLQKEMNELEGWIEMLDSWDSTIETLQNTVRTKNTAYTDADTKHVSTRSDYFAAKRDALSLNARIERILKYLAKMQDPNRSKFKQTQDLYAQYTGDNADPYLYLLGDDTWATLPQETIVELLSGLYRQGGALTRKVLKAQDGNNAPKMTGVALSDPNGTWRQDIWEKHLRQIILEGLADKANKNANDEFFKWINGMLRNHSAIYRQAHNAGDFTRKAWVPKDESVKNYQKAYHTAGLNALVIGKVWNRYKLDGKRTSHDAPGSWTTDNAFSSITDDRRLLGRREDWEDSQVLDFNGKLKNLGYEMYLNDGYYYLRKLKAEGDTPVGGEPNPVGENPNPAAPGDLEEVENPYGIAGGEETNPKGSSTKTGFLDRISLKAPSPWPFLRYSFLRGKNWKNTLAAIRAERPYLQDPQTDYTFVHSSLRDEIQGAQTLADFLRIGKHASTSDGAKQMAYLKELWQQGLRYKEAGLQRSDETYRRTQKEDQAQRLANHTAEHKVAEANKLSSLETEKNIQDDLKAARGVDLESTDTLLQELLKKDETNKAKQNAATKEANLAMLSSAIDNDPNLYGADLSSDELEAYRRVLSGELYTTLDSATKKVYDKARAKVNEAKIKERYKLEGVTDFAYTYDPSNPLGNSYTTTLTDPKKVKTAKDGDKITIAKLKKQIKEDSIFLKSIDKKLDILDRLLSRISKSKYGLPKLTVVS